MDSMKRDMLAKVAETKAACEANIEAKAVELAEELEMADRCPCAPQQLAWYVSAYSRVRTVRIRCLSDSCFSFASPCGL